MKTDKLSADDNQTKNSSQNNAQHLDFQKTKLIKFEKRKVNREDKIGSKIWALLIIFSSILAISRLTIIGQFLDDLILDLIFGWFKYVIYFFILVISFAVFSGIQIKIKRRIKILTITLILISSWILNDLVLLIKTNNAALTFDKNWFVKTLAFYLNNWLQNSIFFNKLNIDQFFDINGSYFVPLAGGGLVGMFFSGLAGYLTTIFSFLLANFFLFMIVLWILTGNPYYIFQWKKNQKHHKLHVVKVTGEPVTKKSLKANKTKTKKYYETINVNQWTASDRQIFHTTQESDITIKLPSANLYDNLISEDLLFDDIYSHDDGNKKQHQTNSGPEIKFSDKPPLQNRLYNFEFNEEDENPITANHNFQDEVKPINQSKLPLQHQEFINNIHLSPFNKVQTAAESFQADPRMTTNKITTPVSELLEILDSQNNIANESVVVNDVIVNNFTPEPNLIPKKNDKINGSQLASNYFPSIINPHYQLPPITLLSKSTITANRDLNIKTAKINSDKIHRLFKQFNVDAKVKTINIGPTITKFEIGIGDGVKVSKITSLENDIKLILASKDIRLEAPIHGKSAVGIEIPNISPSLVGMREVLENIPINKTDSKLLMAIGKNVMGKILFAELDKMPHLLIAGATGSGKSICINSIVASLLFRAKPHEVKFLLIDPKRVELSVYNELPHLLVPVITDLKKANRALKHIINEMERRYLIFANLGVKNIDTYNDKVDFVERLPYIVIIIDELADLMIVAGKEIEESIMRITQMARAAGIHLIIATQRPSTDIITGVIKNNIPSRIAFAVSSSIDSRTILDSMGAEKLIGSGDMLFAPYGQITPTRAQGVYINDNDINALIKFITKQQKPEFNEQLNEVTTRLNTSHILLGEDDVLYEEVRDFVIANKKASASLIQRRFGVGYNRAARLIESLETNGIVGPANGSKPRQVFNIEGN